MKPKNPQWNTTNHGFEITLNRGCTVEPCEEPTGNEAIPHHNFNFVSVEQLDNVPEGQQVDVCAIVVTCTEPVTFTAKSGKEMTKRVLELADISQCKIELTCFGAPTQNLADGSVIAVRKAKVGSWNTKSLTTWADTAITLHPDIPQAHELMGWWRSQGSGASLRALSMSGMGGSGKAARRIVFSDIEDQALGLNGEADAFSVRCMVTHIKSDQRQLWYIACPTCKKKLVGADEMEMQAHCEKCDKTVAGTRRWIFVATCNDASGSRLISFFDDTASILLSGKTADEMAQLKDQNPVALDQHFMACTFRSYMLRGRVKSDMYNDEAKLKVSCTALSPVDWVGEGRALLQEIQLMRPQAGY